MNHWTLLATLWLILILLFVRSRRGPTVSTATRRIAFCATEPVSADDLFAYLLSANVAIFEHDDFNQLGSALGRKRVASILALDEGVTCIGDCLRVIEERMGRLGVASLAEDTAYHAWRHGLTIESDEYAALHETCKFLVADGSMVELTRLRGMWLSPMACDIQRTAYLARLGFSAGYLSRDHAREVLARLERVARVHYTSWEEFSLSALVGIGISSRIDPFDLGSWHRITRSHRVLMAARQSTLRHASGWKDLRVPLRSADTAVSPALRAGVAV